eukprot:11185284-Lingulodinium_polyedra.AAC.1
MVATGGRPAQRPGCGGPGEAIGATVLAAPVLSEQQGVAERAPAAMRAASATQAAPTARGPS